MRMPRHPKKGLSSCTDNPENHKDLGVTEDKAHILVKFYKADSSLLTGVIIGKQKVQGQGIAYIRRVGDNKVYVSATQIPAIKQQAGEYISPELISVKREDINSITVSCPNETYILRPGPDDKTVIFENMAEDKKLNNDFANKIFTALSGLSFEEVASLRRKAQRQLNKVTAKDNIKFDGLSLQHWLTDPSSF